MSVRCWRLPLAIDAAAMRADLAALPGSGWPSHFNTGCHDGRWSGLALVSSDGDPARLYDELPAGRAGIATPWLARCPGIAAALGQLPARVQTARLLRLDRGGVIREHRDHGMGLDCGAVRLHVPVVSHPEVEFYLDGLRVPMNEGECWYLDVGLPHRVHNPSPLDRVHLVVDCEADDRLREWLPAADVSELQWQRLRAAAPPGSLQRFERLRDRVLSDPALADRLYAIADTEAFIAEVVRAAAVGELRVTGEDVRAALHAGRRAWAARDSV